MKNKIRLALTVLIVLAVFTGLVICSVDAASGSRGKGKGAGISIGKGLGVGKISGIKGGHGGPSFSSSSLNVNSNPTAMGNSFVKANRGIAESSALSTDSFRANFQAKNTNFFAPLDAARFSFTSLKVNSNPIAMGNSFVDARRGIADSSALSTDGFTFRSVNANTPFLVV